MKDNDRENSLAKDTQYGLYHPKGTPGLAVQGTAILRWKIQMKNWATISWTLSNQKWFLENGGFRIWTNFKVLSWIANGFSGLFLMLYTKNITYLAWEILGAPAARGHLNLKWTTTFRLPVAPRHHQTCKFCHFSDQYVPCVLAQQ